MKRFLEKIDEKINPTEGLISENNESSESVKFGIW